MKRHHKILLVAGALIAPLGSIAVAQTPTPTPAWPKIKTASPTVDKLYEGVKIKSDIEASYEKLEKAEYDSLNLSKKSKLVIRPGTPTPEQNPDGPWSVQVKSKLDGTVQVHTSVNWEPVTLEHIEGHPIPHRGWAFHGTVQALPFNDMPYTNPEYAWEYNGKGDAITPDDSERDAGNTGPDYKIEGNAPDIIKPNEADPVPNSSANIAAQFGNDPPGGMESPVVNVTEPNEWPKNAQLTVTVKDANDVTRPELKNNYFIKFHLPTENWQEIQRDPSAQPADEIHEIDSPNEIIDFTAGSTPITLDIESVRAEYAETGRPSGLSEEIKVWVKPGVKFWAGIDEAGNDTINNTVQFAAGFGAGAAGTALATKYIPAATADILSPYIGQFTTSAISEVFGVMAAKVGLEPVSLSVQPGIDTDKIVNSPLTWMSAVDRGQILDVPPTVVGALMNPGNPQDPRTKWEVATDSTTGPRWQENPIWRFCKMEVYIVKGYKKRWFIGDVYDHHGFVRQIHGSIEIPWIPYLRARYRWVG